MLNQLKYKLNLQHFAEEEAENEDTQENTEQTDSQAETEQKDKTFSQSELDSTVSKAVQKALDKKEKDFQAEAERIRQEAKEEAESFSNLTQKQKEDAEYKKRQEQLEERERKLNERELLTDIQKDLSARELPEEFAEALLPLGDNQKILEKIEGIEKHINDRINNGVKEQLRQSTPKGTSSTPQKVNPFVDGSINLTAQGQMIRAEPETAKRLIQEAGGNPANYNL